MLKSYLISIFLITIAVQDVFSKDRSTTPAAELEGEANNVLVHYMDIKRDDFIKQLPTVENGIIQAFHNYCDEEAVRCKGIERLSNDTVDVGFVGDDDKEKFRRETRFIIVSLFLTYKDMDNMTQYLPKAALEEFLTKSRSEIIKLGKVDIGYINDKLVYPMRNNLDNYIIIPISLVFVTALVIFNCICQRKREKELLSELQSKSSSQLKRKELEMGYMGDNQETPGFPPVSVNEESELDPMIDSSNNLNKNVKQTEV